MGLPGDQWLFFGRHVSGSARAASLHLHSASHRLCSRAISSEAAGQPLEGQYEMLRAKVSSALKKFPLGAAVTAGGLAGTGDTIAQFVERWRRREEIKEATAAMDPSCQEEELAKVPLWQHDFLRALRMSSYGFLCYGPGSFAWYGFLDRQLPARTFQNFIVKVAANQVVLGPSVLLVVFAWNFAWMGRLGSLGEKYRRDYFPALLVGWKFWIPVAFLNFGVVPLKARVAFMSTASIFWNFYLSSNIGKSSKKTLPALKRAAEPAVQKCPIE